MSAAVEGGPLVLSAERDEEGHRTYTVVYLVKADTTDGPNTVMNASGLPTTGSSWSHSGNVIDNDIWAFCYPTVKVRHHQGKEGERQDFWRVEKTFSSRPLHRCSDTTIEDPLLEPDRISGSFVKYTKEALLDGNGNPIKNSSHEVMRGPQVEIDSNRPTVRIEQNVSALGLSTFSNMIDKLNDATLWGLATRKIKLSNVSWERVLFGTCSFYYVRVFDFDVNFDTFDRIIADEGTMVLNGHFDSNEGTGTGIDEGTETGTSTSTTAIAGTFTGWTLDNLGGAAPDPTNPQHFIKYHDVNGNLARILLDGAGKPLDDEATPVTATFQMYDTANFLTLGIPTVL